EDRDVAPLRRRSSQVRMSQHDRALSASLHRSRRSTVMTAVNASLLEVRLSVLLKLAQPRKPRKSPSPNGYSERGEVALVRLDMVRACAALRLSVFRRLATVALIGPRPQ